MCSYLLLILLLTQQGSKVLCARERNCCSVACPKGDSSKCAISGDHCDTDNSCVILTKDGSFMIDADCTIVNMSYGDNTEEQCLQLKTSNTQSNTFDINHLPFKLMAFSALVDEIEFIGLDLQYPYRQFRKLAYSIKGVRDTNINCIIVIKAAKQIQTENYLSVDCHEGLILTNKVYVLSMCATSENGRSCGQFVFTPPTQEQLVKGDIEIYLQNVEEVFNYGLYIVISICIVIILLIILIIKIVYN